MEATNGFAKDSIIATIMMRRVKTTVYSGTLLFSHIFRMDDVSISTGIERIKIK